VEIKEDPQFRGILMARIAQRELAERSGVHCSDLIYCLNKQAMRRLEPIEPTEKEILLFSIGWSTQRWLTGKAKDEDEREVDGIIVTCDDLVGGTPWELKATYQSNQRPILDQTHWIRQIMCQAFVTKSTTAYLTRLELMGNWKIKEGDRPTLHAYRLEFSQHELDKNWEWMKERAELFTGILDTKALLPKGVALPLGQGYECDYCNYKKQCGEAQ
jgi:hypothetical protein